MCVEVVPPPARTLTRRSVLAGAAALAGTLAAAGPAAAAGDDAAGNDAAASDRRTPGAPGRPGRLVIRGGTLLDPATGEVTENAVVVIEDGTVRATGRRGDVAVPDRTSVV